MDTAKETAAAVQALLAAGDNRQALKDAILKATFLDNIPGEDRQKLRGRVQRVGLSRVVQLHQQRASFVLRNVYCMHLLLKSSSCCL
jgi:hypothetical protein